MAMIKVPDKELGQSRFVRLQEALGWTRAEALGCIALFWADTRRAGVEQASEQVLEQYVSAGRNPGQVLQAMMAAGYLQPVGPGLCAVVGNEGCGQKAEARRAQARKAGSASAARRQRKPTAKATKAAPSSAGLALAGPPVDTAFQQACRATWEAYAQAYTRHTGQAPVRNAKLNALVQTLVKRLGHEEAPHVAAYYVGHPQPQYANRVWPLDALVKDAEALRTQWAAKVRVTPQAAQQHARKATYEQRMARLADEGQ